MVPLNMHGAKYGLVGAINNLVITAKNSQVIQLLSNLFCDLFCNHDNTRTPPPITTNVTAGVKKKKQDLPK